MEERYQQHGVKLIHLLQTAAQQKEPEQQGPGYVCVVLRQWPKLHISSEGVLYRTAADKYQLILKSSSCLQRTASKNGTLSFKENARRAQRHVVLE